MAAENEGLELNLEDTLVPQGTPPSDEASLPNQQQAPAAEAVEEVSSEHTPSLPPNLLTRAQQLGLPLDGIDSSDKLNEFLLDQFANLRPYADYGRSALAQPASVGNAAQERNAQPSEQVDEVDEFDEQKYFSEAWTVPELSAGAKFALNSGAFETNAQGMIVPAPGLEQIALPYIKEINDYQQARNSQNEAFAENPVKFLAEKLLPYFQHKFSPQFESITDQRFEQLAHQNFENQFKEENRSWLYTPDGSALTQDGQRFVETVRELRSQGITDPQKLATYAMRIAGVSTQAAPPSQPAVPNSPPSATTTNNEQRQRDDQGRFLPAGTPAPAPPPKTKQESFIEQARRKAGAEASQGSYASGGEFNVANDGELENLWGEAWKAHSGAAA